MTFIISLGLRQPKEIAIRKWFFEKSHISRNIQSAKLATFAFAICAEVHYTAYLVQPQGEGITVSFEKMWLCWKVSGKETGSEFAISSDHLQNLFLILVPDKSRNHG